MIRYFQVHLLRENGNLYMTPVVEVSPSFISYIHILQRRFGCKLAVFSQCHCRKNNPVWQTVVITNIHPAMKESIKDTSYATGKKRKICDFKTFWSITLLGKPSKLSENFLSLQCKDGAVYPLPPPIFTGEFHPPLANLLRQQGHI